MADPAVLPIVDEDSFPRNYEMVVIETPNPRQVLRIAINLKCLIDSLIRLEYDPIEILRENSEIVNDQVVDLAYEACGGNQINRLSFRKYQSVIIFALLNVYSWYKSLEDAELHNNRLFYIRGLVAQKLGKIIIEREEGKDIHFLFSQLLLKRYSIHEVNDDSALINSLELATDLHCTIIIGSSGFQRCLNWLWRGWIIQSPKNPNNFIIDEVVSSANIWEHFTPDRIKTPAYQNILQIFFSMMFLAFYTIVVNGKDTKKVQPLEKKEWIFYIFTLGNVIDELTKFYYIGNEYFQFWNCFNDTLYAIICLSMSLRFLSISSLNVEYSNEKLDVVSYRVLSCAAPFAWSRLLLYLESEKFIGIMLVVIKHMMKESIIFFFLLILIMIGFFQGFLGLDSSDGELDVTNAVINNLFATIIGYGDFSVFDNFAAPYAGVLFYGYSFIISVILLNILIALYSNAYQTVVDNADEEYITLMSQKTLRFIRAPDEDVYVPPLNVIELLTVPIIRLVNDSQSKQLRHLIMTFIYSPMLVFTSIKEVKIARRINYNRLKRLPDDANEKDTIWDLTDGYVDDTENIFNTSADFVSRATQIKNRETLKLQREEELKDPNFSVDKKWYKKVKNIRLLELNRQVDGFQKLQQRLEKETQKIDELTETIKVLTKMVEKLSVTQE